jgi:hypothetical protein
VDAREREQAIYLETLALLEEAVLELDCDGLILRASPGWNKLAHCDNAVGRNLLEFIHRRGCRRAGDPVRPAAFGRKEPPAVQGAAGGIQSHPAVVDRVPLRGLSR